MKCICGYPLDDCHCPEKEDPLKDFIRTMAQHKADLSRMVEENNRRINVLRKAQNPNSTLEEK